MAGIHLMRGNNRFLFAINRVLLARTIRRLEAYLANKTLNTGQKYQPACASIVTRYFNQPRFLKYHIGTTALSSINTSAYG